jgi:hypothetical protein
MDPRREEIVLVFNVLDLAFEVFAFLSVAGFFRASVRRVVSACFLRLEHCHRGVDLKMGRRWGGHCCRMGCLVWDEIESAGEVTLGLCV